MRILDDSSEAALKDARILLATLRDHLWQFGIAGPDQTALIASIRQLDDGFLLVVVGEFNAGKSALINALLGEKRLTEGVTPTTAQLQVVQYGEVVTDGLAADGLRMVTAPVELLRDLHILSIPPERTRSCVNTSG